MHLRLLSLLLVPAMLIPTSTATAVEASPPGWTNRFVVTYASPLRGDLPAGVREVRADGRRVVVDLGRRATRSDLLRFRDPSIVAIEPDRRVTVALTPSDSSFTSQWDMSDAAAGAADYSVRAPGAWEITTGSSDLTVAVLDTGITSHSEFTGRTVAGYDFISDAQVANDGGLRDSDPSDTGDWITSAEAASGYFVGCDVGDSSWHGTHVAGTIGATGNNGSGIAGLNWGSKIQPIRVLGKCGGYTSDIADAIVWAAGGSVSGVPTNATPAKIISLSLGGYSPEGCSSFMQNAIDTARSLGSLVVVSAGNENWSASLSEPANCVGVITVAATGRDGKRAYYSNYGSTVEIAAPGGNYRSDSGILSTLNSGTRGPSSQSYASYQGTSMAAPHVAGVLSLLLSVDPTLTESEVLGLLATTSTAFPSDGTSNSCSTAGNCGVGIINATALVAAAAPAQVAQTIDFPAQSIRYVGESAFDPGATASSGLPVTYTVSTSSICTTNGSQITVKKAGICQITANQAGNVGYFPATPVNRIAIIMKASKPKAISFPTIGASPVVGTPLNKSAGSWQGTPSPSVSTTWLLCTKTGFGSRSSRPPSGCVVIPGATEASYTPVLADAGKYLRVAETATNSAGAMTQYSATTSVVPLPPSAPTSVVPPAVITKSPRAGSTVKANVGTFAGTAPIAYTYGWYTCTSAVASSTSLTVGCSEVVGATDVQFSTSPVHVGLFFIFRVTATNGLGTLSVFSASNGVVR